MKPSEINVGKDALDPKYESICPELDNVSSYEEFREVWFSILFKYCDFGLNGSGGDDCDK